MPISMLHNPTSWAVTAFARSNRLASAKCARITDQPVQGEKSTMAGNSDGVAGRFAHPHDQADRDTGDHALSLGASGGRSIARKKGSARGTIRKNQITNLPTCWRAPDPPVRRPNQDRLIGPSIVPNPQFSAAWKTQWHDAGLIKFANFQTAVFRRELDG